MSLRTCIGIALTTVSLAGVVRGLSSSIEVEELGSGEGEIPTMETKPQIGDIVADNEGHIYEKGASQRLTKYLKEKHNPSAPPDGFVHVEFEIELVHILGLNEVEQSMTAMVYVEEKWHDDSLEWDPAEFGNLTKTWMPEEDLWLADIIIINMIRHDNLLHSVRAPAMIQHTGTVIYSYPGIYTVLCPIDIEHFPLDEQHCFFDIASWEYGNDKLVLDVVTKHMLDHYKENEEWELLHVNVTNQILHHEDFHSFELLYNVHLKRKPFFYVISLLMPSLIICSISIIGLFAPFSSTGEREEKFTLGVTAILTMAVLSLMVSEKVPHTSKTIPLLVAYFMYEMICVTVATGLTGLILTIHRKDAKSADPPPMWLRRLFRIGKFDQKIRERARTLSTSVTTENGSPTSTSGLKALISRDDPLTDYQKTVQVMLRTLVGILNAIKEEVQNQDVTHRLPGENDLLWSQLASRLDAIGMVLFMAALLAPALYIVSAEIIDQL